MRYSQKWEPQCWGGELGAKRASKWNLSVSFLTSVSCTDRQKKKLRYFYQLILKCFSKDAIPIL